MRDEAGNLTVVALMILAISTLFAIASFQESITEVIIAKNDLSTNLCFYCAEATIVEASNALENASISELEEVMSDTLYATRTLKWVHASTKNPDLTKSKNWKKASDIKSTTKNCENAEYIAIQKIYTGGDILRNESLDMSKSGDKPHEYTIIARSADGGSEATIEIGYRRRF